MKHFNYFQGHCKIGLTVDEMLGIIQRLDISSSF